MSGELIATMGALLTVAGLILNSLRTLRAEFREELKKQREATGELRAEFRSDMAKQREATSELRGAIQSLGERVAKIEGKLEVTLTAAPGG